MKELAYGHRPCGSAEYSSESRRLTPKQTPNSLDLSRLFTKDTGWSFHVSSPMSSHAREPQFTDTALGFIPIISRHSSEMGNWDSCPAPLDLNLALLGIQVALIMVHHKGCLSAQMSCMRLFPEPWVPAQSCCLKEKIVSESRGILRNDQCPPRELEVILQPDSSMPSTLEASLV